MSNLLNDKIESILISAISKLYELEANIGLSYEDLRCLQILCEIKKDYSAGESDAKNTNVDINPDTILELMRKAKSKDPHE
jgi:hypothetical protein